MQTQFEIDLAFELNCFMIIRLENLINARAQLTSKNHWCWTFVRISMIAMSCMIVMQQHVTNIELVKLGQTNKTLVF